jgi:hypothetical protein
MVAWVRIVQQQTMEKWVMLAYVSCWLMFLADPHIGLLHRGTEKLIEYKTYAQVCSRVCSQKPGASLRLY